MNRHQPPWFLSLSMFSNNDQSRLDAKIQPIFPIQLGFFLATSPVSQSLWASTLGKTGPGKLEPAAKALGAATFGSE